MRPTTLRKDVGPPPPSGVAPADATSLTRDAIGTYATRVLIIGLAIITGVITARMLGPYQRGVFTLVYMFASTVVTICKLGLAQANVYSIRRERIPPERVAANALVVALLLGTTVAFFAFLLRGPLLTTVLRGVPQWAMLISLPLIPILLFESYFCAILQAIGKFQLYNRRMLIGTALLVSELFVFLVVFKGGLTAAILVVVINPVFMDGWLLVTAGRMFPLSLRLDRELLKRELKFGLKSHIQVLAQHLHLRADAYLVAYFLNPSEVAFYVLAVRLAEFMLDIPQSVGMALYPRLASLDDRQMHELTAQACRRTVLITTLGATLISLVGPFVIVLWYGHDYAPAGRPLPYIAAGVVSMCVLVSLTQTFTSRNKQQINIAAGVIALVGNIVLNLVLIPRLGIVGAALASLISYTVAAAILIVFFVQRSHLTVLDLLFPRREDFQYFWNLAGRIINKIAAARQPAAVVASERG